jgi:hypothetical protein
MRKASFPRCQANTVSAGGAAVAYGFRGMPGVPCICQRALGRRTFWRVMFRKADAGVEVLGIELGAVPTSK